MTARFLFVFAILFSVFVSSGAVNAQTSDQIREAQYLLERNDRNPGPVDGIWGARTEAALLEFLDDQDVVYDGDLSENELELLRAAPWGVRYRQRPFQANGRTIEHITSPNGRTIFPGRSELPQYLSPPPNDVTLGHYFNEWLRQRAREAFTVQPAGNATAFVSDIRESEFLDGQMRESSALSYLYYEDGVVLYDAMAPAERFQRFDLGPETEFRSQSVGKSLVSYIVGHAICEGFISSYDTQLDDWPLIANTLYAQRTLAEVLNMRARDIHVVNDETGPGLVATGRWPNDFPIAEFAANELDGTQPNPRDTWNYNGLATNIAMNYVIFKTGDSWQSLLERIFQDHVGIQGRIFFTKIRNTPNAGRERGWYSAYANRYDYLRIGVAMLDDWHSDTCIGQYLRDVYDNRRPMNHTFDDPNRMSDVAQGYGGQFWTDFKGMRGRTLFGMNGNNGQNVLIDMDLRRIVVVNSAHTNFDWRTLVYEVIRDGRLPD